MGGSLKVTVAYGPLVWSGMDGSSADSVPRRTLHPPSPPTASGYIILFKSVPDRDTDTSVVLTKHPDIDADTFQSYLHDGYGYFEMAMDTFAPTILLWITT